MRIFAYINPIFTISYAQSNTMLERASIFSSIIQARAPIFQANIELLDPTLIFAIYGISLFNYLLIRLNVKEMKIVQIKKLVKITIVSILVNLLVVKKIISVKSLNMYQLVVNDMCQNLKR